MVVCSEKMTTFITSFEKPFRYTVLLQIHIEYFYRCNYGVEMCRHSSEVAQWSECNLGIIRRIQKLIHACILSVLLQVMHGSKKLLEVCLSIHKVSVVSASYFEGEACFDKAL